MVKKIQVPTDLYEKLAKAAEAKGLTVEEYVSRVVLKKTAEA